MTFSEKMRDMLNQGIESTKDMVGKASAKAKELGELGALQMEIMGLKSQAQKVATQLGWEVYSLFAEKGQTTVSPESASTQALYQKLVSLESEIAQTEEEFKRKGGKPEA
jgi:hypothetical protein